MIENKLIETLNNLGFQNLVLNSENFLSTDSNNQYMRINQSVLLTNITYKAGTFRENHRHPELRITFIRNGIALIKSQNNEVKLNKGDYSIMMPDIDHSLQSLGEESLSICEIVIDATLK